MKQRVLIALFATISAVAAWNADAQSSEAAKNPTGPSVGLARMTSSIPKGHVWATHVVRRSDSLFSSPLCTLPPDGQKDIAWAGANGPVQTDPFKSALAHELKSAGLMAADDPDNLFDERKGASDLVIGGNIEEISGQFCTQTHYRNLSGPGDLPRMVPDKYLLDESTGDIRAKIAWQLYSNAQKSIVYSQETEASFNLDQHEPGNMERGLQGAIERNIHELVSSAKFQAAVRSASVQKAVETAAPQHIVFHGAGSKATKISDAVGAVVLVLSGGGHGSGFLISSDGYVMTAEHVVGTDKYVKIRWSDGLEGVGEIIRTDKRRDVALIKTDPRGRQPLALHRAQPEPGDTVFAIGAPLDVKNQSTVTRGVASANRIMDGFSFIQSDVTISPGNSGGPLLDEKGEVLGICDLTYRPAGADVPTGINYFVPIDDALRFLSAEPQ